MLRTVGLVWVLVCGLSLPAVARAQLSETAVAEARAIFVEAERNYEEENFTLALEGFQRAQVALEGDPRHPLLHFNIARCHEALEDYDAAVVSFRAFLAEAPPDAPMRGESERRVRELEARLRARRAASGAAEPSSAPASGDAPARSGGFGTLGVVGIVMDGLGVASAIAAAVTGLMAHGIYEDLDARCGADGLCPPGSQADIDEGTALATASTVLAPVAAVLAAVGVTFLIIELTSGEEGDAEHATLRFAPSLGGVHLSGSF